MKAYDEDAISSFFGINVEYADGAEGGRENLATKMAAPKSGLWL